MNKRGKSWHLIVTALLIVVFSFTALFGVSYTYGDTKNVYIKGAEDIRFGIDIRGGVDVTFMPADGVEATDDQMTAAKTVITRTASSSVSPGKPAKPTLIPRPPLTRSAPPPRWCSARALLPTAKRS